MTAAGDERADPGLTAAEVLRLQRTAGNQAVLRLLRRRPPTPPAEPPVEPEPEVPPVVQRPTEVEPEPEVPPVVQETKPVRTVPKAEGTNPPVAEALVAKAKPVRRRPPPPPPVEPERDVEVEATTPVAWWRRWVWWLIGLAMTVVVGVVLVLLFRNGRTG